MRFASEHFNSPTLKLFRSAVLIIFAILNVGSVAPASGATSKFSPFLTKKWTTEEGLPQNTVTSVVQTADGYMWLGTFGGLARFDGVKFTVFDSTTTPSLQSNRILSLYEDRWKRLWVGTEAGEVFTLIDGEFVELRSPADFKRVTVWQFVEDDQGRLYIASDSGLERLDFGQDGAVESAAITVVSRQRAYRLAKGPDNSIWTSNGRAYVVRGDELVSADSLGYALPRNILSINFSSDGRMVVGTVSAFGSYENGTFSETVPKDREISVVGCTPAFRNNDLWCQKGNRLFEWKDGEIVTHDLGELVAAGSRALHFDESGNIWLATHSDGLVRLSPKKLSLVGDLTDLNVWARYAVAEDASGAVWLAGHDLLKVQGSRVDRIELSNVFGRPELITSLAIDRNNVVWAGGAAGLYMVKSGRIDSLPDFAPGPIRSLVFDKNDDLWIGTTNGLWLLKDGKLTHLTTRDGLVSNSVHFIFQTKDEAIWVGTVDGISRLKDGRFENFTSENGLSANFVREIFEDDDGTIWIGTYGGGINRLRNGDFDAITTQNGLQDNYVSRILVEEAGNFWVLGNHGIFVVSRDELNNVADGTKSYLVGGIFGVADGMKSSEASGGNQPAGIRAKDGRLWFPMIKDVVVVDPNQIDFRPPKVLVESVKTHSSDSSPLVRILSSRKEPIRLESGESNLEINFTGIEFTNPDRLRFFYKLEGLDQNWVDSSGRRTANYPYLPSGNYVFHVRSVSSTGVWSEEVATVEINVAKRFWETGLFFVMCAAAVVLTVYFAHKIRVARLEARQMQQEGFTRTLIRSHESERLRLAGELHDGIGQNLLIMRNWAELGLKHGELDNEARNHFEQIAEVASNTLAETRTIVGNLSPQNLERFGLSEAIRSIVNQIERSSGIRFETRIENVDELLSNESQLAAYRSLQECLNNVVKHSGSPTATIEVRRSASGVEILVEDVGVGFDAKHIFDDDFAASGFGLKNIGQRVNLLGGTIKVESEPGIKTRVEIWIPKDGT